MKFKLNKVYKIFNPDARDIIEESTVSPKAATPVTPMKANTPLKPLKPVSPTLEPLKSIQPEPNNVEDKDDNKNDDGFVALEIPIVPKSTPPPSLPQQQQEQPQVSVEGLKKSLTESLDMIKTEPIGTRAWLDASMRLHELTMQLQEMEQNTLSLENNEDDHVEQVEEKENGDNENPEEESDDAELNNFLNSNTIQV